jgi:CBS-domain-containing membrane protein
VEHYISQDHAATATVQQWMVRDPYTTTRYEHSSHALQQMQSRRVQYSPVLEAGDLIGLVSEQDLLGAELQTAISNARLDSLGAQTGSYPILVDDVMRSITPTICEDMTLEVATERLLDCAAMAFSVVDCNHKLVGVISIVDVLCAAFATPQHAISSETYGRQRVQTHSDSC